MGRRAPTGMGNGCDALIPHYSRERCITCSASKAGAILRSSESPLYFFGDGEAAGLGAAFG
jgi:hypothetical protein